MEYLSKEKYDEIIAKANELSEMKISGQGANEREKVEADDSTANLSAARSLIKKSKEPLAKGQHKCLISGIS